MADYHVREFILLALIFIGGGIFMLYAGATGLKDYSPWAAYGFIALGVGIIAAIYWVQNTTRC